MKLSKSFIGLVTVSTIFMLYASGLYTNFQSDSALEIVDFSIAKPASEKNISIKSRSCTSLWRPACSYQIFF